MTRVGRQLRILVVAPARYPLRQPHAGGLEASVWSRVRWLRARGHEVTLCAAEGSDHLGPIAEFTLPAPTWARAEEASDTAYPSGYADALAEAMARSLARLRRDRHRFDVVDNHSLDAAPLSWSAEADIPVVTTLHTPPLPAMLEAAAQLGDAPHRFVAVSQHTARAWSDAGVEAFVFPNGVDTDRWRRGPGGPDWVWFGRVVPEKAPHLAVAAARAAGARLVIAGRIGDHDYFRRRIAPTLSDDIRYTGPLRHDALSGLVGASAVALVTPVWEEPFGLVIAEALATGTPVAAFDEGGVSEVLAGMPGSAVVPQHAVDELAAAARDLAGAAQDDPRLRTRIRRAAVQRYSLTSRYRDVERVLAFSAAHGSSRVALPAVAQW